MSEETKKIEEKKHSLSLQQQIYQGPLPPPKILEEYEKIKKGAAKEIFEMARKAQEHNIFQEEKRINLVEKKMKYNFIFGLIGQIGTIVITLVGYFSAFI